ncbi:PLP-dependent aminotransferase family protein [Phreatobacter aquaticus]|uniref:PLP-dependent aminotransferase family protein n=1 Tax=Phreatobacter aquaticus TaxID=2570229 RepID=A0A4D7QJC3_9HYPH|nr:PLP-dependent aminotransferase family protein [Phreatobacter aquaticus]QCK87760.1 PLP-dependent aminotransferase family protein [Phreatobacter aquaticus]
MTTPFSLASLLRTGLPAPAARYAGFPAFNFVGGHNDPGSTPVDGLLEAITTVMRREGRTLATYGLESGPQGYLPLRDFLVSKLKRDADVSCTSDEILITSGSLQGIDLVNALLVGPGDTVIIEQDCYGGSITRLQRLGAKIIGIPLDGDGMRMDALAETLDDLKSRGITPKYIYAIPTIQNPTATIMPLERRRQLLALAMTHGVPIFEDECYSDLIFEGGRPPALMALARTEGWGGVIHIGSFSKSIAPALRVGYLVADWDILARILPLKTDAGSGALEQMVLAEYCNRHFESHVASLNATLRAKRDALVDALHEHFGTAAEFEVPPGGIFLWMTLPASVDTSRLYTVAAAAGIAINPGVEWSVDAGHGRRRLRLCFANPPIDVIRAGVAALAEVCHREMGVPERIGNVQQR